MKDWEKPQNEWSLLDGAIKFEETPVEYNIMILSSLWDIYYELRLYVLARIFYLWALSYHREGDNDNLSISFVKEMNEKINEVEEILTSWNKNITS